jgi:alpha-beta hydrolase superfamily lysophospholipase
MIHQKSIPARHSPAAFLLMLIPFMLGLAVCPRLGAEEFGKTGETSGTGEVPLLVATPDGDLAAYWYETADSKATVILGHGYLNHARGNRRVIDFFLDKGYTVLAWDLPGHGKSWGQPGAIDDFMQYARAFDAVLVHARQRQPDDALSFIGHSTSCAVFMTWQRKIWNAGLSAMPEPGTASFPLETVVLVAPLVRTWLYEVSVFGWSVGRWFINELKPRTSAGSHRPGYSEGFFADPYTVKRMPVSWIEPYRNWELGSRAWEPDPFPLLIIQGTSDTALDWRYNLKFLTQVYPEARVELIDGGWHCLLDEAEPWVSQVYELLDGVFQLPTFSSASMTESGTGSADALVHLLFQQFHAFELPVQ